VELKRNPMRMLCTGCWRTARPDTRIPGSDRAELLAWCCLLLPGLVYGFWRHAGRTKVCPACGCADLVREARAARQRAGEAVAWGGGRLRGGRDVAWPLALGTPRERLRHGGFGALLFGALAVERLLAGLGPPALEAGSSAASLPAAAVAAWLLYQALRVRRLRGAAAACEAFDEHGRSLPIEALP